MNSVKSSRLSVVVCLAALCLWAPMAWPGGVSHWLNETLIDAEDGMLDASDYLDSTRGFLPVPIIITEPAVGYGFGLAVAYFHPMKEIDAGEHSHNGPPSISVVLGAKTENGTYLYGGAHMGVWKDDHVRYTGALAKMNVNMNFYIDGRNEVFDLDRGIEFNIDGTFLLQKMKFRLKESNWWVGADYLYVTADNTFKLDDLLPPSFPDPQFSFDLAGLGLSIEYDGRNTIFTPTSGLWAKLEYKNYDEAWGGDYNFDYIKAGVFHFTPIGSYSSLGLRLQAETVNGDVPFFSYPFVNLRGIPAMRYQGESTLVGEVEYLWGLTPRWTLVLFGGLGHTTAIEAFAGDSKTVGAGGLGFRYRLAKRQGLQAGVDIARGPEDSSIYLTIGSAWAF